MAQTKKPVRLNGLVSRFFSLRYGGPFLPQSAAAETTVYKNTIAVVCCAKSDWTVKFLMAVTIIGISPAVKQFFRQAPDGKIGIFVNPQFVCNLSA
jgi:hypothetical protein